VDHVDGGEHRHEHEHRPWVWTFVPAAVVAATAAALLVVMLATPARRNVPWECCRCRAPLLLAV